MRRIIAVDVGFVATGIVVIDLADQGKMIYHGCLVTKPTTDKKSLYVAHDDARRMQELATGLQEVSVEFDTKRMVVELPHGGSKSARGCRCMALATGAIAATVAMLDLVVEYYTPDQTRKAATGRRMASKDEVVAAMGAIYPQILDISPAQAREAVADAAATFEAAKAGNLIRL